MLYIKVFLASLQHYELTRYLPSDDIAPFVENYWIANWDLTDAEPYIQGNLPQPCQNILINPNSKSGIFGIQTGKFSYKFEGRGRIFGIKFWPGAFYTFYKKPVKNLADRLIPIADTFGASDKELEQELLATTNFSEITHHIENILRKQSPLLDSKAIEVRKVVEYIEQNRDIVSVSMLAEVFSHSPRTLQRLFDVYVGMSPKWVIDRYRMREAVAELNDNASISIVELSNRLGYFDQAHFTKAFSKLVGYPPSRYNFK